MSKAQVVARRSLVSTEIAGRQAEQNDPVMCFSVLLCCRVPAWCRNKASGVQPETARSMALSQP